MLCSNGTAFDTKCPCFCFLRLHDLTLGAVPTRNTDKEQCLTPAQRADKKAAKKAAGAKRDAELEAAARKKAEGAKSSVTY